MRAPIFIRRDIERDDKPVIMQREETFANEFARMRRTTGRKRMSITSRLGIARARACVGNPAKTTVAE